MKQLLEVTNRIGARPALIRMASVSDQFGDTAPYQVQEGIAIINIAGPLSNAAWSWNGTTYGDIQRQLKTADTDPQVRGILLNVNSPGGETDNAFETAEVIAAASKPVYAVAATIAYSAAYLLASQAEVIYCTRTSGGVGSIGVYCAHFDHSRMLQAQGIQPTLISAGNGKTDANPYEPLSESGRQDIQEEIDRLYGEFVAGVSLGRGMSATSVVKLGSRTYDGAANAIAAGLADLPGDLETALADLCALTGQSASSRSAKRLSGSYAEISMIVDYCAIAGKPELAAPFVDAGRSASEVLRELGAICGVR